MSTTTARITAIENDIAEIKALLVGLSGSAPAKAAKPAPKVTQPKADPKARHLVKKNRADFVKAHAWAKGLSTLDIAIAVVHHNAPLKGSWAIGEGYTEKARTATAAAKRAVKAAL